jgi:hypothetical protein
MTLLKVGLKVITITWCFILLLLAMRVFLQWLSVFPNDPIPFIDYTAAMLIIVLAVFSFRENRIAFSVSCMLVLFSVITGVWGMLLLRDGCYLPSAVVAGFGVVYILVKLL